MTGTTSETSNRAGVFFYKKNNHKTFNNMQDENTPVRYIKFHLQFNTI